MLGGSRLERLGVGDRREGDNEARNLVEAGHRFLVRSRYPDHDALSSNELANTAFWQGSDYQMLVVSGNYLIDALKLCDRIGHFYARDTPLVGAYLQAASWLTTNITRGSLFVRARLILGESWDVDYPGTGFSTYANKTEGSVFDEVGKRMPMAEKCPHWLTSAVAEKQDSEEGRGRQSR